MLAKRGSCSRIQTRARCRYRESALAPPRRPRAAWRRSSCRRWPRARWRSWCCGRERPRRSARCRGSPLPPRRRPRSMSIRSRATSRSRRTGATSSTRAARAIACSCSCGRSTGWSRWHSRRLAGPRRPSPRRTASGLASSSRAAAGRGSRRWRSPAGARSTCAASMAPVVAPRGARTARSSSPPRRQRPGCSGSRRRAASRRC